MGVQLGLFVNSYRSNVYCSSSWLWQTHTTKQMLSCHGQIVALTQCVLISLSIHHKVHSPVLQPQAVSIPPYTEPLDVTMTTDDHVNYTATVHQSHNGSSPGGNLAASLPPDDTLTTPQLRHTVSGSAVRRSNRCNKGQPLEHLQNYICNAHLGDVETRI